MNKRNTRRLSRMKRVRQFCTDNQLDAHPAVATESTSLDTCITDLESAGVRQAGGAGSITGAVDHRLQIAHDLHQLLASLAKAAKRLDRAAYPEVAGKMRMRGATDSFAKLLTRALLFAETLAPITAAFVALGAPADVDEELNTLITALQTAGSRKTSSMDTQINGTLSIEAKAREGIAHIQTLDAIFTQLFRKDPVMLAQWNVVKRATPYPSANDTAVPSPHPTTSASTEIAATSTGAAMSSSPDTDGRLLAPQVPLKAAIANETNRHSPAFKAFAPLPTMPQKAAAKT